MMVSFRTTVERVELHVNNFLPPTGLNNCPERFVAASFWTWAMGFELWPESRPYKCPAAGPPVNQMQLECWRRHPGLGRLSTCGRQLGSGRLKVSALPQLPASVLSGISGEIHPATATTMGHGSLA